MASVVALTVLHSHGAEVGPGVFLLEAPQPQGHVPGGHGVHQGHSIFTGGGPTDVRQHLVWA